MVLEAQLYVPTDSCGNWKLSGKIEEMELQTQISPHNIADNNYNNGNYGYSYPSIYNHQNSYLYNANGPVNGTMSQQPNYQNVSLPSYQYEQSHYLSNVQNNKPIITSGSSTADSIGSMGSDNVDFNVNSQKKRRKPAPTIATGRRNLKNENVSPEEAERRDKRRERNRKSAQRCRERKIEKKDNLQKEISTVSVTCRKYLDLAEKILKAWKERLKVLDQKLPGNNFKPQLSINEFEQLIETCNVRTKENADISDNCSTKSSSTTMVIQNPLVKQEYMLSAADSHMTQPNPGGFVGNCAKLDPIYSTGYGHEMPSQGSVVINSGFQQYHTYNGEPSLAFI